MFYILFVATSAFLWSTVNAATGDLTRVLGSDNGAYGSRLGTRLTNGLGVNGDDVLVVMSLEYKFISTADAGTGASIQLPHWSSGQWMTHGCGNIIVHGTNGGHFYSSLLDPTDDTVTVGGSVSISSGTWTNSQDTYAAEFNGDCTKLYFPGTVAGGSTKTGFHSFDVDPTTGVVSNPLYHQCGDAVCEDGTSTTYDQPQVKWATSGDGNHLFFGRPLSTTGTGANVGAVLHYTYDGSSWSESWLYNPLEKAGGKFGQSVAAKGKRLFVTHFGDDSATSTASNGRISVFKDDGTGTYVFETVIVPTTGTYFGQILDAYNSERICASSATAVDKLVVFDYIGSSWVEILDQTVTISPGASQMNVEGGACGNRYIAAGDGTWNANEGFFDTYELPAAPEPPAECTTTSDCTDGKYCVSSVCNVPKVCATWEDCYGEFDAGRLPYCDPVALLCKDIKASTCTTAPTCGVANEKYYNTLNSIGSLSQTFDNVQNASVRADAALQSATQMRAAVVVGGTTQLSILMEGVETVRLNSELFTQNDEATVLADIRDLRCGTQTGSCTVTINKGSRVLLRGRDLQGGTYEVIVTYELTDDGFAGIENSTAFDDPAFLSELAAAAGTDVSGVSVASTGGSLVITYTVTATSDGDEVVEDDAFDQINDLATSLDTVTASVVSNLGLSESDISSSDVDLCGGRDCGGFGAELCNEETGVCDCPVGWWGVNCDTECSCSNGGECNGVGDCQCVYPFYGVRCNQNVTAVCDCVV
jgi:hypothetical protein